MENGSRRGFLGMAGAAVWGAEGGPRIGILLATTYTTGTLEQRLDEARGHGLECAQVSMACAGLAEMPEEIPAGLAERFRRAAAERGIGIASVQGTFNMCHPDPSQRVAGLRRLRVLAEDCAGLGTSRIHICTGTRDPNSMWRKHADNGTAEAWRDMSACVRAAVAMAREVGVVLAFEPEMSNVVDSAKKARRLMDEIGSEHLKVTIDPANLFHTGELPRMKEILEEAFELIGKDVVLAHAKDLDHDGEAGHKAAGEGVLDYDLYVRLLKKQGYSGPLLLHGLSRAQVPRCVAFLKGETGAGLLVVSERFARTEGGVAIAAVAALEFDGVEDGLEARADQEPRDCVGVERGVKDADGVGAGGEVREGESAVGVRGGEGAGIALGTDQLDASGADGGRLRGKGGGRFDQSTSEGCRGGGSGEEPEMIEISALTASADGYGEGEAGEGSGFAGGEGDGGDGETLEAGDGDGEGVAGWREGIDEELAGGAGLALEIELRGS